MRRTIAAAAVVALAVLAAYLALWPVGAEPVAWSPPPAPPESAFPANDGFARLERIGRGVARGPEATAIDAQGRVHTGTRDGRILRLAPGSAQFQEIARTGGRPVGMAFDRAGQLYVCDAERGLLLLTPAGQLRTLATAHAGIPFGFTDDVDVAPDGTVYFSDASSVPSRRTMAGIRKDILEHGGHGRLLAYHPETGRTELLLSGLQFANGIAVAGDGSYVLVNETGAYRVTRYWLAGPRRGTRDTFADDLPGLPDNITWSSARRAFWVALYSPRVPALDQLAPYPFLRKVVLRVPQALQPQPSPQGFALALGEDGRVVQTLRDASRGAYAPVTSVRERDGVLWVGSLEADGLGRLPAPPLPRVAEMGDTPSEVKP